MALKFPVPALHPKLDWPKSEEEKIPEWKGDQIGLYEKGATPTPFWVQFLAS